MRSDVKSTVKEMVQDVKPERSACKADAAHDWVHTGPQEVAPGIVRLPLPMPDTGLQAVNVYAVVDGDGLILIDAGWEGDETTSRLRAGLGPAGFSLSDVRDIFVTHIHRDHYSEAMVIRRLAGARVGLAAGERPNLDALLSSNASAVQYGYFDLIRSHGGEELVGAVLNGGFESSGFAGGVWEQPDVWLEPASTIELEQRQLKVISTPGHTRGHVVFLDADNGVLFAGDHVLPHITPSIGLQPAMTKLPLGEYLSSLDLMLTMADATLLPAHGYPTPSVHERVRELIAHHDNRLGAAEAILLASTSNSLTAADIARNLPWTSRMREFRELNAFHQMLAIAETAAHLDVLATRQVAMKQDIDGRCVYRTARTDHHEQPSLEHR
jgi:glyoxylase-like metal-dependent hydrolase (beta-lactamase superfamily II)